MHEPSAAVDADARVVIDACLQIHRAIGPGYIESIYAEALAIELRARDVPFRREARFVVRYRHYVVGEHVVDFLVRDHLIVELKAVDRLAPIHHAQVISYLRASRLDVALLVNFSALLLRDGMRRVVLTKRWRAWSVAEDSESPP